MDPLKVIIRLLGVQDVEVEDIFIVGEIGSMSLAAKKLKTTQATVSRHIQFLEETLGRQLINRSTAGSPLTHIGLKVHEQIRKMHHGACGVEQVVRTHIQQNRRIIVSCGEMTSVLLSRNIVTLQKDAKNVEIIITSTNNFLDLAAGEADVVIRNRMHDEEGFVYQPLERTSLERYSIYGNRSTFKKGARLKPKQFIDYDWVVYSRTKVKLQSSWLKKHVPRSAIKFKVHHAALVLDVLSATPNTLALLPRFVGEAISEFVEVFTPKEDLSFKRYIVRRDEVDPHAKQIMKNISTIFSESN
jgi:DNA-binding transcriptional LysR family regulator